MISPDRPDVGDGKSEGEHLSRVQLLSREVQLRVLCRAESIVQDAMGYDSTIRQEPLVAMSVAASNLWNHMTVTDGYMGYPEETPRGKEGGREPLSEVTARWLALAALALPRTVENQRILDQAGHTGPRELKDEQARYNTVLVNAFARSPSSMGLEDFRTTIWHLMPSEILHNSDCEAYERVLNIRTKGMLAEQQ